MVIFPNCKINIGLNIISKRSDGYHDLETVFYPVPFYDILEIIRGDSDSFSQSGLSIEGRQENNLCIKALKLVRDQFPDLPPVKMHLHKTIPMGAGLGGGSSDGAHTLLLLNQKFNLGLSTQELIEMALTLGSDCPFFILNKPCFAWSRGEQMEPIRLPLQQFQLVLINPGIHINTGWAFSQIKPAQAGFQLKELSGLDLSQWKEKATNDFQLPVSGRYPVIQSIIDHCYRSGAIFASMSGSGSTCFALFEPGASLPEFTSFPGVWSLRVKLP